MRIASCKVTTLYRLNPALAAREGLEPPTFALGKRCSILLSYRAAARAGQGA